MITSAMHPAAAAPPASAPRASVLVVEDEPTIAEVVARYLERAGYRARIASDGPRALALCAQSPPDLVVLDIMLPGIDGLEVMRRLREREGSPTRVILLTARGRESERIVGLRRGADDYVVKPFSPGELVARVEAVLRRERPVAQHLHVLELDGLRIELATRTVMVCAYDDAPTGDHPPRDEGGIGSNGSTPTEGAGASGAREVALTAREFDLLAFLARHPGQVFSRDRLMELVWQLPDYTDSSTVTVHIRRLRAKLEPDPEHPRYIQTVWGVGYRFRTVSTDLR
jgi:DNA-binding response OmpR family regulator